MCVVPDVCPEVRRLVPPTLDPCFEGDLETGLELVDAVVRQLQASVGAVLPREDMVSLGRHGMLHAMRRFDPHRGTPFRRFVSCRIRGAILDGMRTEALMPRRAFAQLGGEVRFDDDDNIDSIADMGGAAASPEDALMRAELMQAVLAQVERLPPMEAELVRRHYLAEEPIEHVARDLGLSRSWASRVLARAMASLRLHLTEHEATHPPTPAPHRHQAPRPQPEHSRLRPGARLTHKRRCSVMYQLMKGQFVLWHNDARGRRRGSQPDGDTVWFKPKSTAAAERLGAQVRDGRLSLRLEGIDALEIHMAGRHHQRLPDCVDARDALLGRLGFGQVSWRPINDEPHLTVADAEHPAVPGYILTSGIDNARNRRLVSWVFAGETARRDTTRIALRPDEMRGSVNAHLAKTGRAYPMLYESAPQELRQTVAELARKAQTQRLGVWAHDATVSGARVRNEDDLAGLAIWPKLYRRLLAFYREGRTDVRELPAWLQEKPRDRDDALTVGATGEKKRLHEVIETTPQRLKMLVDPAGVVVG